MRLEVAAQSYEPCTASVAGSFRAMLVIIITRPMDYVHPPEETQLWCIFAYHVTEIIIKD